MNSNFQCIFSEFGKIDNLFNDFTTIKANKEEVKNNRAKALELKLQNFCNEITSLDFEAMNYKLEKLEVDNLFVKNDNIVKEDSNKEQETIRSKIRENNDHRNKAEQVSGHRNNINKNKDIFTQDLINDSDTTEHKDNEMSKFINSLLSSD